MAALVDHARYNHLPSLEEANLSRQALSDNVINGPISNLFLRFANHHEYCLYLQHRHHTVGADEAVVKVENSAYLMDSQTIEDIISFGNKVVPTTWMASEGKMLPMESPTPAPTPEFFSEFLSFLASNGCSDVFGIDTLAKSAWSEISTGDVSVVVPNNNSDDYKADKFIPVAFAFDDQKPEFKVHGKCNSSQHKHTRPAPKPAPEPKPE